MIKICTDKYLPSKDLRIKAANSSIKENPDNIPTGKFSHPLALALETGKKWANGRTISCYFMEGSKTQKLKVEREAHRWEEFANVKFLFSNKSNSEIRIAFDKSGGSWSYLGTDSNYVPYSEKTINFGWLEDNTSDAEYQRVVVHEFGHALGAIHEHQSPGANIPWNKEAVYKYYKGAPNFWSEEDVNVNIFAKYNGTITQFSKFDTKSIMLYAIPSSLTIGGFQVGWNPGMSETDKNFISSCYPKNIVSAPSELITGAAPIVGSLNIDELQAFVFKVGFNEGGMYQFTSYPKSLWISIFSGGKNITYSKGNLRLPLGPGQYSVKVRHSTGAGVYNIGVKRV